MDWREIANTNISHINTDKFIQRVRVNATTKNERFIRQSGVAKAAGFPPSLVALDLVVGCWKAYQSDTRTIVNRDGNILTDMSAEGITKPSISLLFKKWKCPPLKNARQHGMII